MYLNTLYLADLNALCSAMYLVRCFILHAQRLMLPIVTNKKRKSCKKYLPQNATYFYIDFSVMYL